MSCFHQKQYDSNDVIFSDRGEKIIYCHFKDIFIRDEKVGEIDKTLFFGGILVVFPKQTSPLLSIFAKNEKIARSMYGIAKSMYGIPRSKNGFAKMDKLESELKK